MNINYNLESNESSICKECGGQCCQNMGCEIFPNDVIKRYGEITKETILKLLDTDAVSIDWWEGDPREEIGLEPMFAKVFYLRMRNVGCEKIDASYGGAACVKWSKENGCALTWENRPYGGRSITPNTHYPDGCHSCLGPDVHVKQLCAIEWTQYQNIFDDLIENELKEEYEKTDNAPVNYLRTLYSYPSPFDEMIDRVMLDAMHELLQ